MKTDWRTAAAGGLAGAFFAIAIILALAESGLLPGSARNGGTIRDYLMAHPEILIAMSNKLQVQQQADADTTRQNAVDKLGAKAFFDPRVAFIAGPANANKTIVEFFDYNCPFCRASNSAVRAYYDKHKTDTRFAFIEFPIKGPNSTDAARLALAARKQPDKYLAFHFALMSEDGEADAASVVQIAKKVGLDLKKLQTDEQDPSIDSEIAAAHALAQAANIDGTPAFIVNGRIREGAVDGMVLKALTKG